MKNIVVGLGTFPYKQELENVLPKALGLGYSFVDTSDDYENEEFVGKYINNKQLKIFSKFSYVHLINNFENHFNASKKKLEANGGYLSCYLMHWPYPFLYKKIWSKMEELYLSGKVDEIGVCNFTCKHLMKLMKSCRVKPMYNEIEVHPLFQQRDTVEFCQNNGIKVISYSPFARMDKRLFENEVLKEIAKREETSIANIILKWNIEKNCIPIPSTSKEKHLLDMSINNLDKIELTDDDIKHVDNLECNGRIRYNPDTYFSVKTKVKFFLRSLGVR